MRKTVLGGYRGLRYLEVTHFLWASHLVQFYHDSMNKLHNTILRPLKTQYKISYFEATDLFYFSFTANFL